MSEIKVPKWLDDTINFLWKNKKRLAEFDSPDYGGLPKRCYKRLSPDMVDLIQDGMPFSGYTKARFRDSIVGSHLIDRSNP